MGSRTRGWETRPKTGLEIRFGGSGIPPVLGPCMGGDVDPTTKNWLIGSPSPKSQFCYPRGSASFLSNVAVYLLLADAHIIPPTSRFSGSHISSRGGAMFARARALVAGSKHPPSQPPSTHEPLFLICFFIFCSCWQLFPRNRSPAC